MASVLTFFNIFFRIKHINRGILWYNMIGIGVY